MNTEVLLDPQGDLPAPPGYQIIETEVDFLKWATDDTQLLIRGSSLCAWADAFYSLRGRPYRYQESLSAALRRIFPELSEQQAKALSQRIGYEAVSPDQVSVELILNYCYPTDTSLWQGVASIEHSARWLLWLYSHQPDESEKIILEQFAHQLEAKANDAPEAVMYRATDLEQAKSLIHAWFGLDEDGKEFGFGEFPLSVPSVLLNDIKLKWMQRIIETEGRYFEQMLSTPLPVRLRQELANLAVQYYKEHTEHLTRRVLWQLQPYLSTQSISLLEERLPPPKPSTLPREETAVLNWFQSEYLPYRWWQARFGDDHALKFVTNSAQAFADWYLKRYPQWLLESKWISFQQSAILQGSAPNSVTFCIILDGLFAWDAEDFARSIFAKVERLQLQEKSYFFAPLPTVTEFAKDALLKGVPPNLAPDSQPLAKILPDNSYPLRELMDTNPGDLVFWRLSQPDAAYHFEADAKRQRQVRAELETILQALKEVVDSLPQDISLKVVITSDHGRLLNAKSQRRLPVSEGMQAHGRVAWGNLNQEFDENGFLVDERAGWIAVHGGRFGMSHDMLIALGEDSFRKNKAGKDAYPHGGLFPEEAIVPWFVFERDKQIPSMQITIDGEGEAGNAGKITVTATNPSRIAIECLAVSLSHGPEVRERWNIPPLDKTKFDINITHWPTKADLPTLKAVLLFRQLNGATFRLDVIPSLEVKSMYERDDSLFKELGLDE